LKLQQYCDRALNEQIALVRCYHQSNNALQQWVKQATNMTSSLHLFGRKYKNIIDKEIDEIKIYYQSMKQIVSSLDEAENARIMKGVVLDDLQLISSTPTTHPSTIQPIQLLPPPSSSSSSSSIVSSSSSKILVCPLDLLARGIIGPEVSSLIHTLRIHKSSLETTSDHLYHLCEKINNEVKKEMSFLWNTTDNFLYASGISNDLIISSNNNSKSDVGGKNGNSRSNRNRMLSICKDDDVYNDSV
jgi:hypothetical protein